MKTTGGRDVVEVQKGEMKALLFFLILCLEEQRQEMAMAVLCAWLPFRRRDRRGNYMFAVSSEG